MAALVDLGKDEEESKVPLSDAFTYFLFYNFRLEQVKTSDIKVVHKYNLGDTSMITFCVRYDPNDKYLAVGK
jgi:hypothetical protein